MTKLQTILKERNLSQRDLHRKSVEMCVTPLSIDSICRICKGQRTHYSIDTLIKICKILELTPNDILQKSDYDNLFK